MSVKVIYEGKEYKSKVDFAVSLGFRPQDASVVYDYLINGRKYIGQGIKKHKMFEHNGVTYTSVNDFAKKNGVTYTKAKHILGLGVKKQARAVKVTCFGKDYATLTSLALEYGISIDNLRYRLRTGMTPEDAVTKPVSTRKEIVLFGKTYSGLSDIAKDYKTTPATLQRRLQKGHKLENILCDKTKSYLPLKRPKREKEIKKPLIRIEGVDYHSVQKVADVLGISVYLLRHRIRKGYTIEQAIEPDFNKKYGAMLKHNVWVNGKLYSSKREVAKAFGLNKTTLTNRLKKGFSIEQAVDPEFRSKYKKSETSCLRLDTLPNFIVNGVGFNTKKQIAEYFNISPELLGYRLRKGFTLEQATDPYFNTKYTTRGNKISHKGVDYTSLKSLAENMNIDYEKLRYRLKKGMLLEDAIKDSSKPVSVWEYI